MPDTNEEDIVRMSRRVVLPGPITTIEIHVRFELTPEELARVRTALDETPIYEVEKP